MVGLGDPVPVFLIRYLLSLHFHLGMDGRLREVIYILTEFHSGRLFRFCLLSLKLHCLSRIQMDWDNVLLKFI